MRKRFAVLLVCILVAGSMPVLAADRTGNGFVFANTKGLMIGDFYSETLTASKPSAPAVPVNPALENPSAPAVPMNPALENKTNMKDVHDIGTDTTEKSTDNREQAQNPAPASTDYDNVEMGDNMLQASVDGTKMTFYLESTNAAYDGYELTYISFTPEGKARYRIYLRIPLRATAGSYSNSKGKACYFSVETRYNEEEGLWGDSYRMVHHGSSVKGIGTYSLTLDSDMGFEYSEGSGSFEAEMEGFSTATKGMGMSVTDGVFRYKKGETHQVVQDWQSGSLAGSSGGWVDPYAGTDKQEKKTCSKCGGNGRIICSYCDGAGTLLQRKEGVNLGSGSTGYTVEVDCRACNGGYIKCSRCGGSGYEY